MNENLTDINIVLDRSGSMGSIRTDMEGGLNSFIEDQKKVEGEATVTLYQFDHNFEKVFVAKAIEDVIGIELNPSGMTALHDAIGMSIVKTGERLAAMDEKDRPSKVVFVIITDGYENSSKEYTSEAVKALIEQQEKTYSWEFVFLGANQDAVKEAANFGISASKAMTYDFSSKGVGGASAGLSASMTSYRSVKDGKMEFSAEQKAAANEDGA